MRRNRDIPHSTPSFPDKQVNYYYLKEKLRQLKVQMQKSNRVLLQTLYAPNLPRKESGHGSSLESISGWCGVG